MSNWTVGSSLRSLRGAQGVRSRMRRRRLRFLFGGSGLENRGATAYRMDSRMSMAGPDVYRVIPTGVSEKE